MERYRESEAHAPMSCDHIIPPKSIMAVHTTCSDTLNGVATTSP